MVKWLRGLEQIDSDLLGFLVAMGFMALVVLCITIGVYIHMIVSAFNAQCA